MTERLTTLAAVKDWLEITTDGSDAFLVRLIDAASQFTLNYISRDSFAARDYTDNFLGNGKSSMLLRNWPILSISSLGSAGRTIGPATVGNVGLFSNGYVIGPMRGAPMSVDLYGDTFWFRAPSQAIYRAGFETTWEGLIPTAIVTDPVQINTTYTPTQGGQWIEDSAVKIDDIAATLIPYNIETVLTTGQYMVSEWGTYLFALDDVGKTAKITYSFAPWDISQAVCEMIGEWYKRKDRIGLLSKTLGGQETVTFSGKDMNDSIKAAFNYYNNVVPM